MLGALTDDLKRKLDGMLRLAIAGVVVAAAATVAFFCFSIALFLWTQHAYGTLEAWLALGVLFAAVAAVAGIAALIVRRRPAMRPPQHPRPGAAARLMQDPAVLLTGLQIVRVLGARNVLPVVLLGALAGGLLMGRNGHREQHGPAEAVERDDGFDAG